jgi:16S rRNA (cytosine967-C5)-methyltransferase
LVYITCSVLRAENEAIVGELLATQPDAQPVAFTLPVGHAALVGWQILPGDGDLDGMYYAVLQKLP